ncbi:hypothetical protein PVAND_012884 [Polypedilum vanderplanki]|uniref:Sodium/solute symporter n=1 Tax=Polypedilum vanderplanki TaxID=319348 RepID=A0A9J6CPR9_POLVA|nr:hypothetical protein PVAND_012884 [Polypedilum vanderplanki]
MKTTILLILFLSAAMFEINADQPVQLIDGIFNSSGINYLLKFSKNFFKTEHQDELNCNELEQRSFSFYDYSVVAAMLIISLGIGVFYGFFEKKPDSSNASSNDFMLGTGMTVFPVTLSLTTSFITAIELLGNPAEMYFNGGQYALIVIAMLLVIPVAIKIFFPIYDKMQLTSCYEYLGVRFGKELRIFGAVLYVLQMCFYTSVSVLAPAIALSKVTGLNMRLAIVMIYIVCIFYSSQGGLKAVVIADTFQTCVLVVSLILILVIGTYLQDGGIAEIFKINNERDRMHLLDFDVNPTKRHTAFSVVIGGFFYWASLLCVNQATVQKAMSLRNLGKAKIALSLSVLGLATIFFANFYTGWMMFAHYESCDPLTAGKISEQDQLVPYYVMDTFGHFPAFSGIFVAGVFAASLGTVAACLSSLSAVTLEDLCIFGLNIKISPQNATKYAKWMNFGYGVISFGLIFLVEGRSILQATLTLNGLIGGIALGLFSLGIFFKTANLKGALYGGLLSTVLVITLGIFALTYNEDTEYLDLSVEECGCIVDLNSTMSSMPQNIAHDSEQWYTYIYKVSYIWYSMIGTILTIVLGLIMSIITQCISEMKIKKLSGQIPKNNSGIFRSNSMQQERPERKISTIAHDASIKIENTIRAMTNNHISQKHEDTLNFVNEVSIQSTIENTTSSNNTSVTKMFEIGEVARKRGIDNMAMEYGNVINMCKSKN